MVCMVRGGCLAWKRMDQDCNVKVERKELSGGVRSVLAVPSDSLLQQDFSAAATARQVTGSPSPSCPLYGWRSRPHPEAHYPAARASSTSHMTISPQRCSWLRPGLALPSTALPESKDKKPPKSRREALCRRSLGLRKAFIVLWEAENNASGPVALRQKTASKLGPSPATGPSPPCQRGRREARGEVGTAVSASTYPCISRKPERGREKAGQRWPAWPFKARQ